MALRERLRQVYWIGGGSGAGKSTIARRLATRSGLRVYDTDEGMADHARRLPAGAAPYLDRFKSVDMDERWVNRSPAAMLDTFHWFRAEGFDLIVADLLHQPADTAAVIAEGLRRLPHLVAPLLADPGNAVWLLPTPEFREAAFDRRGTAWEIARRTSDPERARRNLLERDRMFTERLVEETERLDLHAITVDTAMSEAELADRVAGTFRLGPGEPRGRET